METDEAQDEASSFPKMPSTTIAIFKHLNLDALLHGVNAAGLSAFNPVECRMAPLSHDLSGLILLHDSYRNHLDASGKTIDLELEKQNFFKAAKVLFEVWSNMAIDGCKVDCQTALLGQEYVLKDADPKWIANHVQQSRYPLQVIKCFNEECCPVFVTD